MIKFPACGTWQPTEDDGRRRSMEEIIIVEVTALDELIQKSS